MNGAGAILAACLLLVPSPAPAATVEVSFPLDGYYRPGRYMPVRLVSPTVPVPLRLFATGAVTTEVAAGGDVDAVVPWLVVETLHDARWSAGGNTGPVGAELRALGDDEALVGIDGAVRAPPQELTELLPGKALVPVLLDRSTPLAGDPVAWETLDALVLSRAPDAPQVSALLAAGTLVLVTSQERPDARWPWRGGPGRWVLRHGVAGPVGGISADAYLPTSGWSPGWPAVLRRRVLLVALLYALAAVGATLLRRRAVVAVVGLSAVAAALAVAWAARQPLVPEALGAVVATDGVLTQRDAWDFARPLRAGGASAERAEAARPVFASPRHFETSSMTLRCDASGRPSSFHWTSPAGGTMAFLSRSVHPGEPRSASRAQGPATPSPLRELARQAYLGPRDRIEGETPEALPPGGSPWYETWPAVVVRRASD